MNRTRLFSWISASLLLVAGSFFVPISSAQDSRPFILPMLDPPGPNTWLLGQPYGNTIGAYLRGDQWYSAGQRLHFGLDFSMPCGTPLVAIGDGDVLFVDNLGFGSAPHNVLIRHDAGFVSLYGHLLNRAPVVPGQRVRAGDLVGYSGDPDLTCTSRPHLHFELRSLDYSTTYNPVEYINANWDMLASIGSFRYPVFQQDLDNARRWMQLDEQPNVVFGGQALNLYAAPNPDHRAGQPLDNPPMPNAAAPISDNASATLRRIGNEGCCTGARWHPFDGTLLFAIDGAPNQRAGLYRWNLAANDLFEIVGSTPQPFTSADGTHTIAPLNGSEFQIQQVQADGVANTWVLNTGGEYPSLSVDNSRVVFLVRGDESAQPMTSVWVANKDGSNARVLLAAAGASARWLDDHRLLVSRREGLATRLDVIDTLTDSGATLGQWERVRGLTIAPGGGRIMFYISNQPDPTTSGVYTIETVGGAVAQHMPWFGAWQWRDADSVYYLPYEPQSPTHTLRYYHVGTGQDRLLSNAAMPPFAVDGGDWSVSANGETIAFMNALDNATWVINVR